MNYCWRIFHVENIACQYFLKEKCNETNYLIIYLQGIYDDRLKAAQKIIDFTEYSLNNIRFTAILILFELKIRHNYLISD